MISLVAPFLAFLRLWALGFPVRGGQEISPYVSRDGRYFFFMSARALERADLQGRGRLTHPPPTFS
jgi:hypothetical protein